jgi:hypothetical protein
MVMSLAESEDWPEGHLIIVPHAWRGDGLWTDMQSEAQERIGATLRQMYAELLQRPLPPGLERLVRRIETRSATLPHEC